MKMNNFKKIVPNVLMLNSLLLLISLKLYAQDFSYENQDLTHLTREEVINLLEKRASLKGSRLKDHVLDGLNFHQYDLTGLDLSNQTLPHNISDLNLTAVKLAPGQINNKNYLGTNFSYVDLSQQKLPAFLATLNLTGAKFAPHQLDKTYIANANLSYVDLSQQYLRKRMMSNTNLTGVKLRPWQFHTDYILDGSNLSDLDFTVQDLPRLLGKIKLTNMKMRKDQLNGKELSSADFSGVDLRQVQLPYNLKGANFEGAIIGPEQLKYADLAWSNLSFHDLSQHDLSHTNLNDAILIGAKFHPNQLENKNLLRAKLDEVDLMNQSYNVFNQVVKFSYTKIILFAGKRIPKDEIIFYRSTFIEEFHRRLNQKKNFAPMADISSKALYIDNNYESALPDEICLKIIQSTFNFQQHNHNIISELLQFANLMKVNKQFLHVVNDHKIVNFMNEFLLSSLKISQEDLSWANLILIEILKDHPYLVRYYQQFYF